MRVYYGGLWGVNTGARCESAPDRLDQSAAVSIRSGFDEAISPASTGSSTVDLENFLTCSEVTLECFGSVFLLVLFLLPSTPAVLVRPGIAEQSVIAEGHREEVRPPRLSLKFNVTVLRDTKRERPSSR